MNTLPKPYQQFRKNHAKVYKTYEKLGETIANDGPLSEKTRELIKLGMAAAAKSESAVHSHTHRALDAGASSAEVEHALLLGVTTLGFPAMMTALTWAQAAIGSHTQK